MLKFNQVHALTDTGILCIINHCKDVFFDELTVQDIDERGEAG